jgi:hypothetical protein
MYAPRPAQYAAPQYYAGPNYPAPYYNDNSQ